MIALSNGVKVIDTNVAHTGKVMDIGAPCTVATEDVLHMCALLDIKTGVDHAKLIESGNFISKVLKRDN